MSTSFNSIETVMAPGEKVTKIWTWKGIFQGNIFTQRQDSRLATKAEIRR